MKTFNSKITVKRTIATIFTFLFTAMFVWWGMHFPGAKPAFGKGRRFSDRLHADARAERDDRGSYRNAISYL